MSEYIPEKTCKNCIYYLARYGFVSNVLTDIGGECINYNSCYPDKCVPSKMHGDCLSWESKEKGNDDIPF